MIDHLKTAALATLLVCSLVGAGLFIAMFAQDYITDYLAEPEVKPSNITPVDPDVLRMMRIGCIEAFACDLNNCQWWPEDDCQQPPVVTAPPLNNRF